MKKIWQTFDKKIYDLLLANVKGYGYFKKYTPSHEQLPVKYKKIVFDNSTGTCRYGYQVLIYV